MNIVNIRRGGAAELLRTLGAFCLDSMLFFRVPEKKQSLCPLFVLELTTPRARTLENDILPSSNTGTFAGIRKHSYPIPSTFAHCLHSLDLVLPSVFHDQRKSSLRHEDTLYELLWCKRRDGLWID
jgi:hypothetical protein